jgi:predicted kinase
MKFINYLEESINDAGILKAIFMIGSPGSGKSYTLSQISSGRLPIRIVNTDKFFEYFGNDPLFKDKSKQLTTSQLANYLNSLLPLFVDNTPSNPNNLIRRKGLLESLGYDVGAVFVHTDLQLALERARKRERRVPEEFITKVYKQIEGMKDFYKSSFFTYYEIDNGQGELTSETILRAYRRVSAFFSAPVSNPLGKNLIERMRNTKEKYLSPNIYSKDYLQTLVSVWYSQ